MAEQVQGEHLERIALPAPVRQWRRAANLATVARLRARPAAAPIEAGRVRYPKVFVVGCGRSGTSWVQAIIGRHPTVLSSQESHAYEIVYRQVAALGHRSVRPWAKVLHRHDLAQREARWVGLHWWVDRPQLCALIASAMATTDRSSGDVAEDVIEAMFDTYFFANGGTGDRTLLEKTPGHINVADLILRRFPEAKIVEVLRDGRDVCVSMQMQALTLRWPPRERAAQVESWMKAAQCGMDLRANPEFTPRVHLVRYEDLKADPIVEITKLYAFCGFGTDANEIADVADRSDFRHHRQTGAGRHTRRGEVGDWQNHFSAEDEALFRSMVGELFEEAGYRY